MIKICLMIFRELQLKKANINLGVGSNKSNNQNSQNTYRP